MRLAPGNVTMGALWAESRWNALLGQGDGPGKQNGVRAVFYDLKALTKEQYRDSSRLQKRIDLHSRFSTNSYGWFRWVYDQFQLPLDSRILELGCGPGYLWLENMDRIASGWATTLSDYSEGMVQQARQNLSSQDSRFDFVAVDAQSIPFAGERFDAIVANHMLYHVPDKARALSEMRRVLKPQGRLFATTIGRDHMRELRELLDRFGASPVAEQPGQIADFILEDGASCLGRWFSAVTRRRYEDSLRVTRAEPLVEYVLSSSWMGVSSDRRDEFTRFVTRELAANGGEIHIQKDSGIFVAR